MSMYGTRDAAAIGAAECRRIFKGAGGKQGKSSLCIFHNFSNTITVMVHGDDFVGIGKPGELSKLCEVLENNCKLKVETLSRDKRGCAG